MHSKRILIASALSLLLGDSLLTAHAQQASPEVMPPKEPVYFVEPGSGRKVSRYWIELPFKGGIRRQFRIPCECPHVLAELEFDEAARDKVISRSLWQKVAADCRYMRYLTRHSTATVIDHVSTFDFANAAIDRFPLDRDCLSGGDAATGRCNPFEIDRRGMLRYFPLGQADGVTKELDNPQACKLHDGLFQGILWITAAGTKCFGTDEVNGVRLVGIDFADVNGDGILDAVLRLSTLGPMATPQRLRLPLTRSSADADFKTPVPIIDDTTLR